MRLDQIFDNLHPVKSSEFKGTCSPRLLGMGSDYECYQYDVDKRIHVAPHDNQYFIIMALPDSTFIVKTCTNLDALKRNLEYFFEQAAPNRN